MVAKMSNPIKYDFEQAWILLVEAERMRRLANQIEIGFEECGDTVPDLHDEEVKRLRLTTSELRTLARKGLRQLGYEPDCEIGPELDELVSSAANAIEKLQGNIVSNSPKFAADIYRFGAVSLRDWQDANPSPVRPKRVE